MRTHTKFSAKCHDLPFKRIFRNDVRRHLLHLLLGMFFVLCAAGQAAAFPVEVISDTSFVSIQQVQLATQQTMLQSQIYRTGEQSRIGQVLQYAKEAEEWIDTVNHYSQMIQANVKRFTQLSGIMGFAEQQLGLSEDTLRSLRDLGEAIRAVKSLQNQFIGMIRSHLAFLNDLQRRAETGIFDPEADLNDLEQYLTQTMGRGSRNVFMTRQRIAQNDPELERLTGELERVRARRTAAETEKKEILRQLGNETGLQTRARIVGTNPDGTSSTGSGGGRFSLSADAVNTQTLKVGQLDQLIAELTKQESDLMEKISKRYQAWHAQFDSAYFTGEQWTDAMSGWTAFTEAKNSAIGAMVDTYGVGGRVRVVPSPTPNR